MIDLEQMYVIVRQVSNAETVINKQIEGEGDAWG